MLDDLKHSLRTLRRTPLSSLSAICILAVAIGASAAVFSVVDKGSSVRCHSMNHIASS
jgi:hypothetical protein